MKNAPDASLPLFLLGILSGVIGVVSYLFYKNLKPADLATGINPTDFATLLAGFGGAVLGGFVSWLLARQTSAETLARDDAIRIADQKTLAISVLLKAQEIANGYAAQRAYISGALSAADLQEPPHESMWNLVRPQIDSNLPTPTFLASEFMPLVLAGRTELINDCQSISMKFNILKASFEIYTQKREELQNVIAPYVFKSSPGGPITAAIPDDKAEVIGILSTEADALIKQIYKNILEDLPKALALCDNLTLTYEKYFGAGSFIKMVPVRDGKGAK